MNDTNNNDNKNIFYVTEDNFEEEVLKAQLPTVLDFYADWCTFCKIMMPTYHEVAAEYEGKVRFAVVNVDEQKKFAIANKVVSIPALLFYKNGELIDRVVGALDAAQLKGKVDALL